MSLPFLKNNLLRRFSLGLITLCAVLSIGFANVTLATNPPATGAGTGSLQSDITTQTNNTADAIYGPSTSSNQRGRLASIVGQIIKAFLGLLGVVAVILLIYAGVLWMTAQGEDERVTKAKEIIKQSIIGLVIIFLAYGITAFVIDALVTGALQQSSSGSGAGN